MKRVYRKRDKTQKFIQKLRSGIEEGGVHKTAKFISHEKVKSVARSLKGLQCNVSVHLKIEQVISEQSHFQT